MDRLILVGAVHRDPMGKRRLLRTLEEIRPDVISLEVSPASVELRTRKRREWMALFKGRIRQESERTGQSLSRMMAGSGLRGVYEYMRLPYEYRAALAYSQKHDTPLFLLDDSKLAASYLEQVESELLNRDNIRQLAHAAKGNGLIKEVAAMYERAANLLAVSRDEPVPPDTLAKNLTSWADREEELAQRLRLLHQGLARRAGRSIQGRELAAGLIVAPEAVAHMPETVDLKPGDVHVYVGGWQHLVEDQSQITLYSRLKDLNPERVLCVHN